MESDPTCKDKFVPDIKLLKCEQQLMKRVEHPSSPSRRCDDVFVCVWFVLCKHCFFYDDFCDCLVIDIVCLLSAIVNISNKYNLNSR